MASIEPLISRYMNEFTKEELAKMLVELNFEGLRMHREIEKLKRERGDENDTHRRN